MTLTTEQQILIEQRVTNESKSVAAAYLIWLFLGCFGGHRFYVGKKGSGVAILLLTVVGILTAAIAVGIIFLVVVGIWVFVDLFLIPGMVDDHRRKMRDEMTMNASVPKAALES